MDPMHWADPRGHHGIGGHDRRLEGRTGARDILFSRAGGAVSDHRPRDKQVSWFLFEVSATLAQSRDRFRHCLDSDRGIDRQWVFELVIEFETRVNAAKSGKPAEG